jgi:ribosome biogenesis GTPase
LSKQTQIIASNMDLACIVVSAVAPVTSTGFIDRFLVTAEAYHLPVLIIYNKVDIYGLDIYNEMSSVYAKIGYQTMAVSAKEYIGIDALKDFLKNKTTLFTGHSGVGKSSLLNILIPGTERKVGEISDSTMMGKHTTTFAEMIDMPDGGSIIDTPGIRDLGVIDIDKKELAHYFPEMRKLMNECKFNNCIHVNEPQCAVLKAVNDGVLDPGRYYNYLSILRNEDVMG